MEWKLEKRPAVSDVVLLVHFEGPVYDRGFDLPDMRRALQALDIPYREVWAVSDHLIPEPHADLIWPPPESRADLEGTKDDAGQDTN